jgi:apolipoprotein N-acyltransferase
LRNASDRSFKKGAKKWKKPKYVRLSCFWFIFVVQLLMIWWYVGAFKSSRLPASSLAGGAGGAAYFKKII